MGELLSLLRFSAGSGHIWLDEQRMLLLHARAFAELRKELLDSLGVERARGLLVRMGFASGQRDGELAVRERHAGLRTEEAFMLGPRLHSIEGIVRQAGRGLAARALPRLLPPAPRGRAPDRVQHRAGEPAQLAAATRTS